MKTNTMVKGKTEKQFLENKLIQLLHIYGVSGEEERVQKYLIRELNELENDYVKVDGYGNIHAQFTLGTGEGTVLHFNSHMDTVSGVKENKRIINDNGVFSAVLPTGERGVLGADDRAGIATILTLLNFMPNFDGVIKVSFYREEEIGCVGSTNSDKTFLDNVDLAITFDRRGSSDIVVGCMGQPFASEEVGTWLETLSDDKNYKYKAVEGGISDALTVSEYGINAINISVGYYNEHTINEFLIFSELFTTFEFTKEIIKEINSVSSTFSEVPSETKWIASWGNSYSDYRYTDDNYGKSYNGGGSLFAPTAYIEDGKYAILTDGNYEMDMNIDEVTDLIKQLQEVRDELESNEMFYGWESNGREERMFNQGE